MKKYIGWVFCFAVLSIWICRCEMHFCERSSSVWAENCCGPYGCTIQVENHLGMELPGVRVRLYQEKKGDTAVYFQKDSFEQGSEVQTRRFSETDTDEDGLVHFYGLPEGTYYLEEVHVPSGYEVLKERITIQIDEDSTGYGVDYYIVNGAVKLK